MSDETPTTETKSEFIAERCNHMHQCAKTSRTLVKVIWQELPFAKRKKINALLDGIVATQIEIQTAAHMVSEVRDG